MDEKQNLIHWQEVEPLCVLRLLRRKLWLIVLAALIGAMSASIVLTGLVSRSYTSTATFVVTPRTGTTKGLSGACRPDLALAYDD